MMPRLLTTACFAAIASACASPPAHPPAAVGMANPASVYCLQKGGVSVPQDDGQGEYRLCHLPGGTLVEEWELYRRDHPAQ